MPASCASRLFDDGQDGISLVHPQCILSQHFTYLQLLAYYPSL